MDDVDGDAVRTDPIQGRADPFFFPDEDDSQLLRIDFRCLDGAARDDFGAVVAPQNSSSILMTSRPA
jgi:hypothetical protein